MIIKAAIRHNGLICVGKRHGNILQAMAKAGLIDNRVTQQEQGFITNKGTFLNRYESYTHAILSGQLPGDVNKGSKALTSEDLW